MSPVRRDFLAGGRDATYEVVDLGAFDGRPTIAMDIDARGTVYGRHGTGPTARSFRWTSRLGYEDLGGPDGLAFNLNAATDFGLLNGNVIVGPGQQRAVALHPADGFIYIDAPHLGTSVGSSASGSVAGTRRNADGSTSAFVWSRSGGVTLLPLEVDGATGVTSSAADVNERGAVAGNLSWRNAAGRQEQRAFMWDATGGTRLVPPAGPGLVGATFVSNSGVVVGASEARPPRPGETRVDPRSSTPGAVPVLGWAWGESAGLRILPGLGGTHSVPWDVDNQGNVYGWSSDASGVRHSVRWPASGGVEKLGSLGGHSQLGGLNHRGDLAGWATAPNGETHAVKYLRRGSR